MKINPVHNKAKTQKHMFLPLALLEMTDQLILLLFHATGSSFEMELR